MKIHEVRNAKTTILESQSEIEEGLLDIFKKDPNVHKPSRQQKKDAKKREKGIKQLTNRAFEMWKDHLDQVRQSIPGDEIPPERIKADLETFIQNNVLGGRKIASMTNASDIQHFVDQLSGAEAKDEEPKADELAGQASDETPAAEPAAEPARGGVDPIAARMGQTTAAATKAAAPEKKVTEPQKISRAGIERISTTPMVLKRGRTEYVIGDDGEWVKYGQTKPENETIQTLLNQAAEEFENADQSAVEQAAAAPAQAAGQWITDPATGEKKWQPAQTTPAGAAQAAAGAQAPWTTTQAPIPGQAAAEKAQMQTATAAQVAQAQAAQAAQAQARDAQDAADRAAGIEPPSRGLKRVGTGRGQQAQFEPIKEDLRRRMATGEITLAEAKAIYHTAKRQRLAEAAEKLSLAKEKELFGKLIRAAVLARPADGSAAPRQARSATQQAEQPGAGKELKSTGDASADKLLTSAGYTVS